MTEGANQHPTLSLVLSDEQEMLATTAKQFVSENATVARLRTLREPDGLGFSSELWAQIAELGWLGLQIPEPHGGLGLGFFDLCVVLEATGRELMPEPFVSTLLLGAQALLVGASESQRERWLPKIASGELLVALGYEEDPSAGGTPVVATRTAQGVTLNGCKTQVFDAHAVGLLLVSAELDGATSLFALDPAMAGVTITRQRRVDHHQASVVRLQDVVVPEDSLVGGEGDGERILEEVLTRARIGLSAQMLGGSERAFERTLDYLRQREQFGALIGSFQALQHRAARLYIEIALARSSVLAAARAVDVSPERADELSALAKGIASSAFLLVAKEAIQMHGGIGVTDEHDIGFYIKRAQAASIAFGDPGQQRRAWANFHGY